MSSNGKGFAYSILHSGMHIVGVGVASVLSIISIVVMDSIAGITEVLVFTIATMYCALVVIPMTSYISKRESSHRSIFIEHFRQTWLLYPLLIYFAFAVILMWNNPNYSGEPGKVLGFVVAYVLALSVILNIVVLFYTNIEIKKR